jgi:hypothetical protein
MSIMSATPEQLGSDFLDTGWKINNTEKNFKVCCMGGGDKSLCFNVRNECPETHRVMYLRVKLQSAIFRLPYLTLLPLATVITAQSGAELKYYALSLFAVHVAW